MSIDIGGSAQYLNLPSSRRELGPWIRPASDSLGQYVLKIRDEVFDAFQSVLDLLNLKGSLIKSADWEEVAVVSCEIWSPVGPAVTRRGKVSLKIQPHPHRECPVEIVGALEITGRTRTVQWLYDSHTPRIDWHELARETIATINSPSHPVPDFFRWRLFRNWHFGRKPDRIVIFAKDRTGIYIGAMMLFGAVPEIGPFVVLCGLVGFGLYRLTHLVQKKVSFVEAGRLEALPRQLVLVDTWYAVMPGLANRASDVIDRLSRREQERGLRHKTACTCERIWHPGLNGIETRDQIVHTLGRAMVFVHVHAYGDDLYIGWDSHLNRGFWMEEPLAEGHTEAGEHVRVTRTVIGEAETSNFDLVDLNTLSENVHRELVREVRRLADENGIHKEFDFTINRQRRDELIERGEQRPTRLRRTG